MTRITKSELQQVIREEIKNTMKLYTEGPNDKFASIENYVAFLNTIGKNDCKIVNGKINSDTYVNLGDSPRNVKNGMIPFPFGKVSGPFSCSGLKLTSLYNCPKEVGGDFWCSKNDLTSLKGAPKRVGGDFWCTTQRTKIRFTEEDVRAVSDVKGDIIV
jgi:hypothetical protein